MTLSYRRTLDILDLNLHMPTNEKKKLKKPCLVSKKKGEKRV